MARSKNILVLGSITESLKKAKALVLADYKGLNVAQMSELRSAVKKAGGNFEVTKNTLLKLAAKNSRFSIPDTQLVGPTAALWTFEDDPAPIKAFVNFAKQNELLKISGACSFRIKFGIWEGEPISADRILQLASLPGVKELQAQMVGRLQSPIVGLVFSLNYNLQKLVIVLKSLSVPLSGTTMGPKGVKN